MFVSCRDKYTIAPTGPTISITPQDIDRAVSDSRAFMEERRRRREAEASGDSAMSEGF